MYDLMQHVYVDASVQPKKGMNEHKALVSMVDRSNYSGKAIVIADRGYESFNNIAHFQEKSWNYIIRSMESYGIISKLAVPDQAEFDIQVTLSLTRRQTKQTLSLLKKDPIRYRWIQPHTTFDYLYPKDDRLYDLCFRVVRFAISDVSYETVFTNLDSGNFPPDTIKELYNRRWGIETSFRELKYAVGLVNLHSKKPSSMLQEVFSRFILYNFSALIAHQAQLPNEATKRINFSAAMLICRQYFRDKLSEDSLLDLIAKHLSLIRKAENSHDSKTQYLLLGLPIGYHRQLQVESDYVTDAGSASVFVMPEI